MAFIYPPPGFVHAVRQWAIAGFLIVSASISCRASVVIQPVSVSTTFFSSQAQLLTTNPGLVAMALPTISGITGLATYATDSAPAIFTATQAGSSAGNAFGSLGLEVDYTANGVFTSPVLYTNYDFSLSDSNGDPIFWLVSSEYLLQIGPSLFGGEVVQSGETAPGGGMVSGSAPSNEGNNTDLTGLTLFGTQVVQLIVAFDGSWNIGDTLTLTVPQGSIDISGASNAVPEPATGTLLLTGGVLLAALRKRRMKA